MAHYFMNENGAFTTMEKKKKKRGNRYIMNENGAFTKVETMDNEDIAPTLTTGNASSFEPGRAKARRNLAFGNKALVKDLNSIDHMAEKDKALYDKWGHLANEADFDEISAKGAKLPDNPISYAIHNRMRLWAEEKNSPGKKREARSVDAMFSPEESRLHDYIRYKLGDEAAAEYRKDMTETLNARYGQAEANLVRNLGADLSSVEISDFPTRKISTLSEDEPEVFAPILANKYDPEFPEREENSTYENVGKALGYAASSIEGGIDQWTSGIKQNFSNEKLPTSPTAYKNQSIVSDLDGFAEYAYKAGNMVGNMLPSIAISAMTGNAAGGLAGHGAVGLSSGGSAYGEALAEGHSQGQARLYGALVGASEVVLGKIAGGLPGMEGFLPKKLLSKIATIDNVFARTAAKLGANITGEIIEEELQNFLEPAFRTFLFDEEYDAPSGEELIETAIVTALSTGVLNAASGTKVDGLTANEAKVLQQETKNRISQAEKDGKKVTTRQKNTIAEQVRSDLEKGRVSTDTIESVLGGETYKAYQSEISKENEFSEKEKAIRSEIAQLESIAESKITVGERNKLNNRYKQLNELYKQRDAFNKSTKKAEYRAKLDEEMTTLIKDEQKRKGSYLAESYNEKARRGEAFTVDLNEYTGGQKEMLKSIMDKKIVNNTRATREFWENVTKIGADKGFNVTAVTTQEILDMMTDRHGAEYVQKNITDKNLTPNGYYMDDGTLAINVESKRGRQFVFGHEITHSLEETKYYEQLQRLVFDYAKTKKTKEGFDSQQKDTIQRYEGMEGTTADKELTADLVGEFVWSDTDFVNHLADTDRNLFQKIFDEVKYLYKMATAGSREQRDLLRIKKVFEKAYRESGKGEKITAENGSNAKYHISETEDGRIAAVIDNDILTDIDTTNWDNTKKEAAKKAASDALKQFSDGIVVDGITRKVNKISRREYTRSNYTEKLYNKSPDIFADKMRAADAAGDIVVAATNWNRDGGLKHPRNDSFVDFEHGTTLIVAGDNKYIAEVVVGITKSGEAVLYDVVDMKPASFEIKKSGTSPTATTQNAIGDIYRSSLNNSIAQNDTSVNDTKRKISLSKPAEQNVYEKAYREGAQAETKGGVQYSIEKFSKDYDAWDKKDPTQVFDVAVTSDALRSIGIEEKHITLDSSKLLKIKSKHQGMTDDVIKRIPSIVNDPMLIMESKQSASRIVLVGELIDANGKGVLAILELNPTNRKGVALDEIKIASAYGKDNLQNFIHTSKILYVNPDNEKTSSWLTSTGLQLPVESLATGFKNSIPQNQKNTSGNLNNFQKGTTLNTGVQYSDISNSFLSVGQSAESDTSTTDNSVAPIPQDVNTEFSFSDKTEDIAPVRNDIPLREMQIDKPSAPESSDDIAPAIEEFDDIAPIKETKKAKVEDTKQQTAEILTEEPKVEKKKRSAWSFFKESVLDKGMVFERLSKKTKNRELEAKWNFIRYADGNAQRLIGKGTEGVKALKDIETEVEKNGLTDQFYEYLYHMLNIDRMTLEKRYKDVPNKPVFGDSVTAEISQEVATQLEKANPKLKDYANDVYAYNRHLRNMLVDGGVISRETADLWEEMYPHYVPIRRVGDTGLSVNVPLDTGKTGVNAPIRRATGGSRNILPLFDTMAQRTLQIYKAVAKNRFGVELKNTLGTTIKSEKTNLDEAINSIDTQDSLLQEGKNGRNPTFTVFENGEKVTFEITDEMYEALKPASALLSYRNEFLGTLSGVQRGLLTEYNPVFTVTNFTKDVQDVLINSQHAAKTYANFPKAISEMASKGEYYTEYMSNGGEQNTYFDNESNTFAKERKGIKKIVGMPLDIISNANNIIERLPRLAEYIASRKSGRSIEVSMLDAARVTTNFAAGGDVTKFLNANGCTFLSASVNGAVQQVRNIREAKMNGLKGWVSLAARYAAAGLAANWLNDLLWDDDEEYEELSDYVKDNYYVIAKTSSGRFIRIPKGRALAVIQNAMDQIKNAATGDDQVDLARFLELAVSNLAPNNPIENNILAPIMQVANNETWYGEDLVPTRLQDLPAAEQYDESTDAISKWLGEKLHYSPYKINYLLNQYSGGVGDVVLPMLTPEAESGDNSLSGNIIAPLKDKFTIDSTMNNQNVSDFYDTVDQLTTNAKSSKATDEDILKYKYMNSVNAELGELYAQKREIQNSDLTNEEKYNQVWEIQEQINMLAEDSLNTFNEVSISDGYATVGDLHYRMNDEGEWEKITDKQLIKQEEVTRGLGISASKYWSNKKEYDYAYENPEKYAVAKSVGGYTAYTDYMNGLREIKGVKDENGDTISGSRKENVIDYVNNLNADYGVKIILFKSMYNSDNTYNMDIVDYLNNQNGLTYDERRMILTELGFTVDADGNVYWD